MVMASPPHTYLGLMSVMAIFLHFVSKSFIVLRGCSILDDDVAGTADDPQTLALNHALGAFANYGLLRGDGDAQGTGIVAV